MNRHEHRKARATGEDATRRLYDEMGKHITDEVMRDQVVIADDGDKAAIDDAMTKARARPPVLLAGMEADLVAVPVTDNDVNLLVWPRQEGAFPPLVKVYQCGFSPKALTSRIRPATH